MKFVVCILTTKYDMATLHSDLPVMSYLYVFCLAGKTYVAWSCWNLARVYRHMPYGNIGTR